MRRHLFLIPIILSTTAAFADAQTAAPSTPADAQAQAAALLSRPHTLGAAKAVARSLSHVPAVDAHEHAAALLSGARSIHRVNAVSAVADSPDAQASTDAQAQAAVLLSGSRPSTAAQLQTKRTHAAQVR